MKIDPIYRAGQRVISSSMETTSQPLIRLEYFKPLVQSVHLELPNLQTARGARFGSKNGAVPNLFDPTGPLPRINGFQVVKPENKIYKEGGVYNNSKCCYNIKKKKKR